MREGALLGTSPDLFTLEVDPSPDQFSNKMISPVNGLNSYIKFIILLLTTLVLCNEAKSKIVNTPLWRVTAFLPSGEIDIPKGSCVIRTISPAGVRNRPLGNTETPVGLIVQN